MPFALASREEDKLTWKESENGIFNLGSAYKLATSQGSMDLFRGKWIWKVRALPRLFLEFNPLCGFAVMRVLG